jgi:hypothetical protein
MVDDGDGTWSLAEVGNGQYCNYWLVATNDWQYPIKMIPGVAVYNNINDALDDGPNEVTEWGDLPTAESVILYRFLMRDSSGGTTNAEIIDIIDERFLNISGSAAVPPADHGALGGLLHDDHPQYILADGTRDFTGVVVGVDPTASNHLTTKEYVDSAIAFIDNFYLLDAASDIGGIYYEASENAADIGGEGTITTSGLGSGDDQALTNWATTSSFPAVNTLRSGVYDLHIHAERTAGTRSVNLYYELYTRTSGGAETLRSTSEISGEITSKTDLELHAIVSSDVDINTTDRLVWKFYANVGSSGSNVDVALYVEGINNSHVTVPTTIGVLNSVYVRQDGSLPLTANWDVGAYTITGTQFISDIAIGTAPLVVTSTTVVTNLNADLLDGNEASAIDYSFVTANDGATDVTASELEELTDGSATVLHSHAGGGASDKIEEGDSKVEVIDAGAGQIVANIDAVQYLDMQDYQIILGKESQSSLVLTNNNISMYFLGSGSNRILSAGSSGITLGTAADTYIHIDPGANDLDFFCSNGQRAYFAAATQNVGVDNYGQLSVGTDGNAHLYVGTGAQEKAVEALVNGAVELYYDNVVSLKTASTGVDIYEVGGDSVSLQISAATSAFDIFNNTNGAWVNLTGKNTAGGNEALIACDPDAGVSLYYQGDLAFNTTAVGCEIRDPGASKQASAYFNGDNFEIYNTKLSGHIRLTGEDSGSAYTTMAIFDPDGSVDLYYDGAKTLETTAEGVAINDTDADDPHLLFRDNGDVTMGQIGWDATSFSIKHAAGLATGFSSVSGGTTSLWHNGANVFQTESAGVKINGASARLNIADRYIITSFADPTTFENNQTAADTYFYGTKTGGGQVDHIRMNPDAGIKLFHADIEAVETTTEGIHVTLGGVKFPATQSPSADANTLDDYEEGTFTATAADAASGGNTGGTGNGYYTKIGRKVHVTITMTNIDTTGLTAGNDFFIQGLPFANFASNSSYGSIRCTNVTFSGHIRAAVNASASAVWIVETISAAANQNVTCGDITDDDTDIWISLTYFTT